MSSEEVHYLEGEERPLYWEAAVLGVAFLALLLGSIGVLIIICHAYQRSRHCKEESRARRAVQLYDSIIVRPEHRQEDPKQDSRTSIVNMPGESAGTMSKAMSYDVNPIYE